MRAIVIALALVGGFYFYTNHHQSTAPSLLGNIGNSGKVEIVEAVGGQSFDAEEGVSTQAGALRGNYPGKAGRPCPNYAQSGWIPHLPVDGLDCRARQD